MEKTVEKIAKDWGWTVETLMEALADGGTSNQIMQISSAQCAHEIIKTLLLKPEVSDV